MQQLMCKNGKCKSSVYYMIKSAGHKSGNLAKQIKMPVFVKI